MRLTGDSSLEYCRLGRKVIFVALACWLTSNSGAPAQRAESRNPSAEVDALFAPWSRDRTPGAAVMVVQDGEVVHKKGYGLADLEAGTPIQPDTSFRLASLSKQFTAMAIMMLAERRRLQYDEPLSKIFPEFRSSARRITIRQLLHHTSGLPDHEGLFLKKGKISGDWPRSAKTPPDSYEPTSHDALKLLARQKRLLFSSGTRFEYSNAGYVVLGQIIEKASGIPYDQFLKKKIFDRLGMRNTVVSDGKCPPVPNLATSYTKENGAYRDIDYTPLNRIVGDEGVFSSLNDLEKWVHALENEDLVKSATLKLAFTHGRLKSCKPTPYGFGWYICESSGLKMFKHDGSWVGFRNFIVYYPQSKLTIVVLANSDQLEVGKLAYRVADIYMKKQALETTQ